MIDARHDVPLCRLCGLGIRDGDDAARLDDEYFHAPCAESAFRGTSTKLTIGDLNSLAIGAGRAVVM